MVGSLAYVDVLGTLEARWLINGFKDYALNRAPRPWEEETSSLQPTLKDVSPEAEKDDVLDPSPSNPQEEESKDESSRKKRRCDKRCSRDSEDKRKPRKDKAKRRHDSDSD